MKTEKATIKLVLRTNKTLADGTHPIMLRVNWRGKRAEKSTGFSCKEANWSMEKFIDEISSYIGDVNDEDLRFSLIELYNYVMSGV